jgi:corrinoid protein of di/trimethylamine methyltransferase
LNDIRENLYRLMAQSILDGDIDTAQGLALQSIEDGYDLQQAITSGYMLGLNQVGEAFACGEAFLPELVMAGEAMKAALSVLVPEMKRRGSDRVVQGKIILATVQGDIHEIGKSLVGTMLTAAGFEVFDLGVDVPAADIIENVRQVGANMVALSALLTTTMIRQKQVIDELVKAGLRFSVKVIVGGAPVTQEWAERIGADGTSQDAVGAVALARRLLHET